MDSSYDFEEAEEQHPELQLDDKELAEREKDFKSTVKSLIKLDLEKLKEQ